MAKGKVKWFDAKKGYGFIVTDDGKDVFVHFSSIATDKTYRTLEQGVEVEFDMFEDEKGNKAANVKVIK